MNVLEATKTTNPLGSEADVAKFIIDDVSTPFTLHGVAVINQQYTLQFWVRSEAAGSLIVCDKTIATNNEWQQHVITFEADGANVGFLFTRAGTYYIYQPQLEKGMIATDWTPSPDDVGLAVSTLTQTATGITISLETLGNTVNTVKSTADTAETNAATAQSTANSASTAASNAQTTANTARTEAANAAKTATNFMSYDSTNGLLIGNKSSGSWSGSRAQITSSAFNILASNGALLASYKANQIDLGINSDATVINFCKGTGSIKNAASGSGWKRMLIEAGDSIDFKTSGKMEFVTGWNENGKRSTNSLLIHSRSPWSNDADGTRIELSSEHNDGSGTVSSFFGVGNSKVFMQVHERTGSKTGTVSLDVKEAISAFSINVDSTWISGAVTAYGDIRLGTNNKALIATNTDGADRRLVVLNNNNNCVINYDGFVNDEGNANIYGSQVNLYIPYGTGNVGVALEKPVSSSDLAGYFRPNKDALVSLGTSSLRWYRLIQSHASVSLSDERAKTNIVPLGGSPAATYSLRGETPSIDIHSELFDRLLPVQYNFINEETKACYGLIAQQVVSAMEEVGLDEHELDLLHHDSWIDEETGEEKDTYGIAYENLIALLIHEVQKLKQQIS